MWGKKDKLPLSPGSAPGGSPDSALPAPARSLSAASPASSGGAALERGRNTAQIGKSLKVKGAISGNEDLYIDGEIEGTVELEQNSLTVGPNGKVHADVTARSITILGRVQGNVRAGERIEIRKTGSLEGDLVTARIVIEDGAVFRGSIDIIKAGAAKPASRTPATPASQPQAASTAKPAPRITAAGAAPGGSG